MNRRLQLAWAGQKYFQNCVVRIDGKWALKKKVEFDINN
jgi:hypothetical protein